MHPACLLLWVGARLTIHAHTFGYEYFHTTYSRLACNVPSHTSGVHKQNTIAILHMIRHTITYCKPKSGSTGELSNLVRALTQKRFLQFPELQGDPIAGELHVVQGSCGGSDGGFQTELRSLLAQCKTHSPSSPSRVFIAPLTRSVTFSILLQPTDPPSLRALCSSRSLLFALRGRRFIIGTRKEFMTSFNSHNVGDTGYRVFPI